LRRQRQPFPQLISILHAQVWCARGEPRPKIRVDVGVETVEILHDSSKALLTLKIRSFVVERGPLRQARRARAHSAALSTPLLRAVALIGV